MGDNSSINILPTELILEIMFVSHPLSILHCRQVSNRLKDIIDTSNDVKVIIDLYEHGCVLVYPRTRPLSDVWANFVRDQRALLQGDARRFRRAGPQQVPDYMITDGVIVRAGADDPFLGPGETSTLQLTSCRYTSKQREIDLRISLTKEGLLRRVAISRQRNILAVAETKVEPSGKHPSYMVYLFPLAGDLSHEPQTLSFDPNNTEGLCSAEWGRLEEINLYENLVSITIKNSRAHFREQHTIVIWDWECGRQLAVLTCVHFFAFLSSQRAVVLYAGYDRVLWVVSLHTLKYRRLIPPDAMSVSECGSQDFAERGTCGEEYVLDRTLDIFLLRVMCIGGSQHIVCVISKQKLDRFVQSLDDAGDLRNKLAWNAWGPPLSRIFKQSDYTLWYARNRDRYHPRPTAGHYQTVFHGDKGLYSGNRPPHAEVIWDRGILDFNPRPIRRGTPSPFEIKLGEVVSEPSILTSEDIRGILFPLESTLPYRRILTDDILVCEPGIWPSDLLFL
ncbi:hypothetical protein PIIN_04555 [Serendipita indica DSM 11827]|uniref:F-box domain-containing protein n=1 Tax=Serendipita indica (strain DSM 11827) TaxID=1109443 RepID=G4TH19_SERID|nr:hypothetical protein PIIN_04555 [Serendipita indica DSM 11827]